MEVGHTLTDSYKDLPTVTLQTMSNLYVYYFPVKMLSESNSNRADELSEADFMACLKSELIRRLSFKMNVGCKQVSNMYELVFFWMF